MVTGGLGFIGSNFVRMLLGRKDAAVAQAVGFVFVFLFYFAALIFGMQLASSVIEEKQSRIVEIIAAAIPLTFLVTWWLLPFKTMNAIAGRHLDMDFSAWTISGLMVVAGTTWVIVYNADVVLGLGPLRSRRSVLARAANQVLDELVGRRRAGERAA